MSNGRDNILEAAERLVAEEGVKRLTIEHVAVAAKLSRGGVLYHFPSKEALIQGMLERLNERFERIIGDLIQGDPEPHGRWMRAFARATLQMDDGTAALFAPLLAALAYDPTLIEPMQARQAEWQAQSEAELGATNGAVVLLAAHALWLNDLFKNFRFSAEEKRAVVEQLVAMTMPSAES